jgi:4-carboxymuconolactone decarboxylase
VLTARLGGTLPGDRCAGHPGEEDTTDYKETLRRLALSDERFMETELRMGLDTVQVSQLDAKTHALVRLGASLAIDAAPSSYQSAVEPALAAGASIDEIVGTLIAVAPTVGLARVVSAAPELALALGYDVDVAIETLDGDEQ